MAQQTPRGIPVPETGDPGNVPAFFQRLASYLDPGALVDYNPAQASTGRIVFLVEGDGDPSTVGVAPLLGTVYVDRSRARLWVPLTQLVNGVDTLSWYRIGADADAEIADLGVSLRGVLRNVDQADGTVQHEIVAVELTGILPGTGTNIWTAGISFPQAFATTPTVMACNGNSVTQPNVVIGVQNVTATGFQVQIARSDVPFQLNDEVTVNYVATA